MASARQLADYQRRLSEFSSDDVDAFHALNREGMELLDLSRVEICEEFDVTTATVDRWLEGESAPHPAFRDLVIGHLRERAGQGVPAPLRAVASSE